MEQKKLRGSQRALQLKHRLVHVLERKQIVRPYVQKCIRTKTDVGAVLPAPHNSLLPESLRLVMLTCSESLSVEFINYYWMFFLA